MLFQKIYDLDWQRCPCTCIVERHLIFPQAIPVNIKPCFLVQILNLIV